VIIRTSCCKSSRLTWGLMAGLGKREDRSDEEATGNRRSQALYTCGSEDSIVETVRIFVLVGQYVSMFVFPGLILRSRE
jgi:hypothetical protein